MDIYVSADYFPALISHRDDLFCLLRTLVVQQRKPAIDAIGDWIPFDDVHAPLQVVGNRLNIQFIQRGGLRLVRPELNVIENLLKIICGRGRIDGTSHRHAIVTVVWNVRSGRQSVWHHIPLSIETVCPTPAKKVCSWRM